jgi:hypothetical protein
MQNRAHIVCTVPVALGVSSNSDPGTQMLGFWRRNSTTPLEFSTTAPSTGYVTPVVTSEVTLLVTTDVTPDVTTSISSTVSSSRIVTSWADPNFPEHPWPTHTVSLWPIDAPPLRYPSAEEIAQELFLAMQKQPLCAGKWVLAMSIEMVVCPRLCQDVPVCSPGCPSGTTSCTPLSTGRMSI